MSLFYTEPKGFTLFELLVLIAIITILGTVVLASIQQMDGTIPCEKYANYSARNIPARCLSSFGINGIAN